MATNNTADNPGAEHAKGTSAPADDTTPEVAELQADIERTRVDLAGTVDQLTAKLDVKTRVRNSVADAKDDAAAQLRHLRDQAADGQGKPTSKTFGIGGGTLAAVIAVVLLALWRRNNTPRRPKGRKR
jgi:hypothetical protein